MNKNKTWIGLAFLVVLAGFAWWVLSKDRSTTLAAGPDAFAVKDTASIDRIEVTTRRGMTAVLDRKNGGWVVNEKYPVAQDRVSLLLETVAKMEVKNPVPLAARENIMKDMASTATEVEIFTDGNLKKRFFVGGPTPDQEGTIMLLDGMEEPMITHVPGFVGYLSPRFFAEENEWRTREIYDINTYDIRSVAVTYPDSPQYSFKLLVKGNDNFELVQQSGGGSTNVKPYPAKLYLNNFRKLYLMDFPSLSSSSLDSLLREGPLAQINVEAEGHQLPQLNIYLKPAEKRTKVIGESGVDMDQYYGTLGDSKDVFLLQSMKINPMLRKYGVWE